MKVEDFSELYGFKGTISDLRTLEIKVLGLRNVLRNVGKMLVS